MEQTTTVGSVSVTAPILEPWIDADTVAKRTGFKSDHIRKLASNGKIPAVTMKNGRRNFWRFKWSLVEAALNASMNSGVTQ